MEAGRGLKAELETGAGTEPARCLAVTAATCAQPAPVSEGQGGAQAAAGDRAARQPGLRMALNGTLSAWLRTCRKQTCS